MNLENVMLSKISIMSKKDNTVSFHFHEVSKIVKIIETESRMVLSRGWEEGEMGSYSSMGVICCTR